MLHFHIGCRSLTLARMASFSMVFTSKFLKRILSIPVLVVGLWSTCVCHLRSAPPEEPHSSTVQSPRSTTMRHTVLCLLTRRHPCTLAVTAAMAPVHMQLARSHSPKELLRLTTPLAAQPMRLVLRALIISLQ